MKRERRKIMLANLHIQGSCRKPFILLKVIWWLFDSSQAAIHPTQNPGCVGSSLPLIHGATSIAPAASPVSTAMPPGRRLESSR
jgi:hypothetical protein